MGNEPALEQHRRAAPSVVAHHRVSGPNTGWNSRIRRIIKTKEKGTLCRESEPIAICNLKSPVSKLEVVKLTGNDAAESRPDQTSARGRIF